MSRPPVSTAHQARRLRFLPCAVLGFCVALAWPGIAAGAETRPLDLTDSTPRTVTVRFEVSGERAPGRLDALWGAARTAYVEPGDVAHELRIRVPASELEAQLRSGGGDPVAGSFSPFVWRLDRRSGHVIEARFRGRMRQTVSLGLIRHRAEIEVETEMSTRRAAGHRPGGNFFGRHLHPYCEASENASRCLAVPGRPYEADRGYVNAVGPLRAKSGWWQIETFSPLGEVVFLERPAPPAVALEGPGLAQDGVCSGEPGRACVVDLRGETP